MYTEAIKIVIIAAHFSLRGITESWTAKRGLWKYNPDQRGGKNERLPNVRRATELEGCTLSECSRISKLRLGKGCNADIIHSSHCFNAM